MSVPRDAVKVKVEKGWVTLTGQVDWHYQQEAAEQDIRRLFGVVGVSNQTTVEPRPSISNISDNIMHALHRTSFFDPNAVTVTAEGGKVRLTGAVHSYHQREMAASITWAAPGVTSVENDVTVV